MLAFIDKIKGVAALEIQGACVEDFLNACAYEGLSLWNFETLDDFTLKVCVYEKQLEALRRLAEKKGFELRLIKLSGGSRGRKFIKSRAWLFICLLLCFGTLMLSSFFIWRVEIRGADNISQGKILRALAECGVECGSFRFGFSNDLVRNKMMTLVPEIGWMSINTNGSRAIVLIEPREEKPVIYDPNAGSYVVAGKTGIIREMSVFNGNALTSVGSSVLEGETLVSAVMESISGESRVVSAKARVMADTWYEISAVYPAESELKTEEIRSYSRFAIKFGKRRINFYFAGRKDIDECDKIVHEYTLGIKGLFALPISLVREELVFTRRGSGSAALETDIGTRLLRQLSEAIDGEIVSSSLSAAEEGGLVYVTLRALCYENIARDIEIDSALGP